jgi:hypothetical protein
MKKNETSVGVRHGDEEKAYAGTDSYGAVYALLGKSSLGGHAAVTSLEISQLLFHCLGLEKVITDLKHVKLLSANIAVGK